MNCPFCDTEAICKTADYLCYNKTLGDIIVPCVGVEECPHCGKVMLSTEAESTVSDYLEVREREAIESLPADDLVSAGKAAEILGVTKQAFSKNPKIKKGFVYYTLVGTKRVFFRSSVKLYKTEGDGRFSINEWKSSVDSGRIAICDTADSGWQQISSSTETADGTANNWNTSIQVMR